MRAHMRPAPDQSIGFPGVRVPVWASTRHPVYTTHTVYSELKADFNLDLMTRELEGIYREEFLRYLKLNGEEIPLYWISPILWSPN